MKKSRKILAVILSVLTLFGVFSVATPVLATEVTEETVESEDDTDKVTVSDEEAEAEVKEPEIVSEIQDMRTESTKYFRMSDGSYMAAQYAQPVHYKENDEWKEYDYSITEKGDELVIENSDSEMSFPEELSEDNEAQIEVSAREYSIKFSPVVEKKLFGILPTGKVKDYEKLKSNRIIEELSQEVKIDEIADQNAEKLKIDNQKSAVVYADVYDDVDFEYEVSSNRIKESIVLNSEQDKNKFEFTVDTDGLFPKKEADGSITLYEDKEYTKPVSSIMKPYMYDANGEYSYDVDMNMQEENGAYILTVTASDSWLNDKARKYPVVIDPTIILDISRENTNDRYVDTKNATTPLPHDEFIYAGNNGLGKTRTFVRFKLPAFPDKCAIIQNATINFFQKDADLGDGTVGFLTIHDVTGEWPNNGAITWNAQPTYDSTVIDYCKIKSGAGEVYSFDITKSVKSWYEGSDNFGIMLKSANESVTKRARFYSAENSAVSAYPVIQVTYRNNVGLEDYWSYSGYSNDTAGAAYVNDYTGNLVYELPILSSISEIMPLSLTGYFNTYKASQKFVVGKSNSSRTVLGKGFRLNLQQTVLSSEKYNLTDTAQEKYPWVYTDGDGTEHYFQKTTEDGATVLKDEDGLGLTLVVNPEDSATGIASTYRITDKSDTSYYFNAKGNLGIIEDANGNRITIKYKGADTANGLEEKTRISQIIDGAGHTFNFAYYVVDGVESDYVKTITDAAGRVVTFTTSSGYLNRITYPDGTYTNVVYEDGDEGLINYVQGFDGYALNFDYTLEAKGRQVQKVKEVGRNSSGTSVYGQIVTFDRTAYNKTVIRSAGMDGYHYTEDSTKGSDDLVTMLQFDNFGRTVSQQVSYGSGKEIGAGNYSYMPGSSTIRSGNKLRTSASLGKNTVNLLYNGNAEGISNWTQYANDTVTSEKGNSTYAYYVGEKSLYIKNTALTGSGVSYYRQNLANPTVGNSYTLSAYVRVNELTQAYDTDKMGAYIQLIAYDSSNNILENVYSERITAKTDTTINRGWRRLTVSITIPENTTVLSSYLSFRDAKGTAYFDCIQLEAGSVANGYNMLENGSFENHTSNAPTAWTVVSDFHIGVNDAGAVLNGSTASAHKNGSRCLRIEGNLVGARGISQTVAVAGNARDTYILSGWGAGYAVDDTWHLEDSAKPQFEIAARVTYKRTKTEDGTTDTVYQYKDSAKFNTTITGWQYSSTAFALRYTSPDPAYTYTPTEILIMPRYNYQANHAYFDHIQLTKDVAQTYTYDDKGNLISTAANAEQKVNATYNDKNDLTSYTDTAGYKTTATYDNKHNLTSSKSARGVITKNSYSANGNPLSTEIWNINDTVSIKTEQVYSGANTTHGIKEGAYLRYAYDENGYATEYQSTWLTGVPIKTIHKNGAETTYEYNTAQNKLTSVTHEGTMVNYTYANQGNRISKITYTGTASNSPSESYSFEYDSYGNVVSTKVGSQTLSTNSYGAKNGALTTVEYGNDDKRNYNYNNLGLVSYITSDNNGATKTSYSWGYTNNGTTRYHRDAENNLKYLYDYDSLGRLIRQEIQNNTTLAHVGSTEVAYDVRNNVTKVAAEFDGYTALDEYMYSSSSGNANASDYAKDNLISRYRIAGSKNVDYTYDSLNRLTGKTLSTTTPVTVNYSYKISVRGDDCRTTQVDKEKIGGVIYQHSYDVEGNITRIDTIFNDETIGYRTYTYDTKNQLTKEVDSASGVTTSFTYDAIGNITQKKQSGAVDKTIAYRYGNDGKTGWSKLLTGVDLNGNNAYDAGETISYDAIGNPTSYLGANLSWYGRQLKSYAKSGTSVSYTYDADGLRGTKTVNGTKSTYHYVGGQLRYETRGALKFYYFYDAAGNLSAIRYFNANGDSAHYFAVTNVRGDVVRLYNSAGTLYASYDYDAWGNCTVTSHVSGATIGELNPIRYRGYYYDSETGLYYLQSRYYNPQVGRFLNADSQISGVGGDVNGYNMFSYCQNNPVNMSDPTGHWPDWATKLAVAVAVVAVVAAVAAVTVATAGAGTAIAAVAVGAAKGAAIGFSVGAASGATIGYATTGTLEGTLNGMANGALSGSISGAITGGVKGYSNYSSAANFLKSNGANPQEVLSSYKGTPKVQTLKADTTVYRTWGGTTQELGHWVSPNNYGSNARNLLSLPAGNTMTNTSSFVLPKGTTVLAGKAAPLFGQSGGGVQWWIPVLG